MTYTRMRYEILVQQEREWRMFVVRVAMSLVKINNFCNIIRNYLTKFFVICNLLLFRQPSERILGARVQDLYFPNHQPPNHIISTLNSPKTTKTITPPQHIFTHQSPRNSTCYIHTQQGYHQLNMSNFHMQNLPHQ